MVSLPPISLHSAGANLIMSQSHLKHVNGFPLSIKYKVLGMSFKAFNYLIPAQFLRLHIFIHPHIHPTILSTPKLSAIFLKSYSSLAPTYLFMHFALLPRNPLILFLSWHTLISQIQQRNCILPKLFLCFMPYLPDQVTVPFLYALHSTVFTPLSCFPFTYITIFWLPDYLLHQNSIF